MFEDDIVDPRRSALLQVDDERVENIADEQDLLIFVRCRRFSRRGEVVDVNLPSGLGETEPARASGHCGTVADDDSRDDGVVALNIYREVSEWRTVIVRVHDLDVLEKRKR